jgi:hypothetical protein
MKKIAFVFISMVAAVTWSRAADDQPKFEVVPGPQASPSQVATPASSMPEAIQKPADNDVSSSMILDDTAPKVPDPENANETIRLTDDPGESTGKPIAYSRRLKLYLRDLAALQKAAKTVGGDIHISITTVGCTPEDLVVPLSKMGYFDIQPKENVIVVKSKSEDPYVTQLRQDVLKLERRRAVLFNDVKLLERLAKDSGYYSTQQSMPASYTPPYTPTYNSDGDPQVPYREPDYKSPYTSPYDPTIDHSSASIPTVVLTPRFGSS